MYVRADAELKKYAIGENMCFEWFTTVGAFRWTQDMTYIHEVQTSTPIERTVFFTFGHS